MNDKDLNERITVINGLGIGEALAITFIILKLTGVITWSWWWLLVCVILF
jgi:hypothetical protein